MVIHRTGRRQIYFRGFTYASIASVPIVIEETLYRAKDPNDKSEVLGIISEITKRLDGYDDQYWIDEQNEGLVAVIFR